MAEEERKVSANNAVRILDFFRSVASQKKQQEQAERRMALQQMQFAVQEQRKRREFVLNKMAGYMNGLKEGPSKELARLRFKSYYEGLPSHEQEALAPSFTRLLSPMDEKLLEFKKMRGEPVDPRLADVTDKVSRAKLEFANEDWRVDRDKYVLGIDRPRTNVIPIDENVWAWRDKEGRMGILSREGSTGQEWIQKTLDEAKMTFDMAMAQGGDVPTGAPKMITDGKMKYELTPMTNIVNGARGFRKIPVGRIVREGERELPRILSDFSTAFTVGEDNFGDTLGKTQGAALYLRVQNELDDLSDEQYQKLSPIGQANVVKGVIRRVLGSQITGWNIEVHNPGAFEGGLWDNFAESSNASIYFIPGKVQPFYNAQGDLVGALYYDEDYDTVRDSTNVVKGTKAEMDARASVAPKGAWLPGGGK